MSRIVAALDGSSHAGLVLAWAMEHAIPTDEVVAMMVWNLSAVAGLENPFGNLNEERLKAVHHVRSVVDHVSKQRWDDHRSNVQVRMDIRHGEPGPELVAASLRAESLVMGGYRQGVTALGSVARYVLPRAHCAVTLVPLPDWEKGKRDPIPV